MHGRYVIALASMRALMRTLMMKALMRTLSFVGVIQEGCR